MTMPYNIQKPDEAWRSQLTPDEYRVTREKGTELPFSGEYNEHYERGMYCCVCCWAALFTSEAKFASGCGWPSFDAPATGDGVETQVDRSHGMVRDEILCSQCGAHLGHVFADGPTPTGQRYCVNSVSLRFQPEAGG